jgi:HEPN domain-containing protein
MTQADLPAQDSRAWMEKALIDLRAARALLDAGLASSALFHCQQAAEKSLKALLVWRGIPFRRVHDLEEIGALCVSIESALAPIVRRAEPLTAYAWKLRYPGEPYEPAASEAEEALDIARLVFDEIRRCLPEAPQAPK